MIGVDYGVRRIAVAFPAMKIAHVYDCTKMSKAEGWDRSQELGEMANWLKATVWPLYGIDPPTLFVESPIGGASGNMRTAVQMGETSGAILACFPGRAVQVAPSSWKALVCGSGRLDKAAVAQWLETHHPALAEACRKPSGKLDQDRVDATCLGLCTTAGLAERSELPRSRQRRVLRQRPEPGDQP